MDFSGGTVSATTGFPAVRNASTGLIKISGTAEIVTENTSYYGTIQFDNGASSDQVLIMTGGTIKNNKPDGSSLCAIMNSGQGVITITGGNIIAGASNYAIRNNNITPNEMGRVILGGNPQITGRIFVNPGKLSVIVTETPDAFSPAEGKNM